MNEDKLKGKNHSFSLFPQLQELKGRVFNSRWERRLNRGEYHEESNEGIKWKEPNTHNINKLTT